MRTCPRCLTEKTEEEFYDRRGYKGKSVYCKPCTSLQTTERQKAYKKKCVEYKGGKCINCGYDKCDAALEFHHLDPTQKDFSIAHSKHTAFNSKTTDELDKCILLCANCHREVHALVTSSVF